MTDTLQKIVAYKRDEIAAAKAQTPPDEIYRMAQDAAPVRPFRQALQAGYTNGKPALIGEIKKASPSKGIIRADFNPPQLAKAYEAGGAHCLSVLTDAPSFQGAPEFLTQARQATHLPCLRKDFLFDPYQVAEARAWQADCILVIMAAVTDTEAKALCDAAQEWDMDALIEVHDQTELDRALALRPNLLGINNRNLKNFTTNLGTTLELAAYVADNAPDDVLLVSESGIATPDDMALLASHGVTACLVGESLMRQDDVETATKQLLG